MSTSPALGGGGTLIISTVFVDGYGNRMRLYVYIQIVRFLHASRVVPAVHSYFKGTDL